MHLRINCGSDTDYIDGDGNSWRADQTNEEASVYRIGGQGHTREAYLPLFPEHLSELIRTECCGMSAYSATLENGSYSVRFILAETHEALSSLKRQFSISINGRAVSESVQPSQIAQGFGRAGILQIDGVQIQDCRLLIEFGEQAQISGLEIIKQETCDYTESISALAPQAITPAKHHDDARIINILFIGHSGTFYWAIPESMQRLIELSDLSIRFEIEAVYHGGKDVKFFCESEPANAALNKGGWDYVVIQDSSWGPFRNPDLFQEYMPQLIQKVRSIGAEPILFAYNVSQKHTAEERQQVVDAYRAMSLNESVVQVPCVRVMQKLLAANPELNYNNPDRHHSGMLAGYAFALCWFSSLTGNSAHAVTEHSCLAGYVSVPECYRAFIADVVDEVIAEYDDEYLKSGILHMDTAEHG